RRAGIRGSPHPGRLPTLLSARHRRAGEVPASPERRGTKGGPESLRLLHSHHAIHRDVWQCLAPPAWPHDLDRSPRQRSEAEMDTSVPRREIASGSCRVHRLLPDPPSRTLPIAIAPRAAQFQREPVIAVRLAANYHWPPTQYRYNRVHRSVIVEVAESCAASG